METERAQLKKCVAEFIGTFILVYIGAGAAAITILLAKGETWQSDFLCKGIGALGGLADWLAIGVAFAIAVTVSIYIFAGNITGASFNPARTFGPYAGNTIFGGPDLWALFPVYIIGPVVGAVIAAFLYTYIAELKT